MLITNIVGGAAVSGYSGTAGQSGYSGLAGPGTAINATDDTATTPLYPVMVGAAGSNQTPKTSTTKLSFNASTGAVTLGIWQGSVINSTYGGTGVNNGGRTLTLNTNSGTLTFTNASTTLTVASTASVSGTNTGDQTSVSGSAGSVANSVTFNNGGAGGATGSTFNGSSALTVSYNTIGAPKTDGTNASGTWGINITGNAATATNGLTTSNYNSYAPTLNGTGAYGTWGINITGNSATATTVSNFPSMSYGYVSGQPTYICGVDGSGNMRVYDPGQMYVGYYVYGVWPSDIRLKENITPIGNALNKVNSLQGVYYNFIKDEKKVKNIGVIAQNVQEVVPELVEWLKPDPETGEKFLGVKYAQTVALLIEAIKELSTEISNIKKQLSS